MILSIDKINACDKIQNTSIIKTLSRLEIEIHFPNLVGIVFSLSIALGSVSILTIVSLSIMKT